MRYRLAILSSHPIQYFAPLYRRMAQHPEIDLTVYYCSRQGFEKYDDLGFNTSFKWDIPLLDGYLYKFLINLSGKRGVGGFWSLFNPSIIGELYRKKYNAILLPGYAYLTFWLAAVSSGVIGTPILLRGDSNLLTHRVVWKRFIKRIGLTYFFSKCAAFLTIGSLNAEYYRWYGVPEYKLFHTPYAVDNTFFTTSVQRHMENCNQIKEKLGINPVLPVVLYVSKMIKGKRPLDVLQAFHQLIQWRIEAQILFVGDGQERSKLESYTKEHQLSRVSFLGFRNQTELPQFYAISDVFVLPSIKEAWGLVINEAMCAGLPIITTDQVGAAPDLVRHGENGYIYPPGNIELLAKYLGKILTNPDQCKAMGRRSLEIISQWSYDECIEGILKALAFVTQPSLPK